MNIDLTYGLTRDEYDELEPTLTRHLTDDPIGHVAYRRINDAAANSRIFTRHHIHSPKPKPAREENAA